jgi:hypothetical protein
MARNKTLVKQYYKNRQKTKVKKAQNRRSVKKRKIGRASFGGMDILKHLTGLMPRRSRRTTIVPITSTNDVTPNVASSYRPTVSSRGAIPGSSGQTRDAAIELQLQSLPVGVIPNLISHNIHMLEAVDYELEEINRTEPGIFGKLDIYYRGPDNIFQSTYKRTIQPLIKTMAERKDLDLDSIEEIMDDLHSHILDFKETILNIINAETSKIEFSHSEFKKVARLFRLILYMEHYSNV